MMRARRQWELGRRTQKGNSVRRRRRRRKIYAGANAANKEDPERVLAAQVYKTTRRWWRSRSRKQ
jgi:hypothetical protein